jgi:MFS superfamily sulfate permease-like transporter
LLRFFTAVLPVNRADVKYDTIAGVTLAAMSIPQALGYARIAGMPVVTGLYSLLLPLLVFAALGSSRYLVVAADSATAAILASGLVGMAPIASAKYVALGGFVALLTAALLLLGRLFRLGFIADFFSQTVLTGFLTGVGLQVGISVLGEMLGTQVHSGRTIVQLIEVCSSLPDVRIPTVLVAASVLAFVFGLHRWSPTIPGSLLAVIVTVAASAVWNFAGHGIATIGAVAGGLPHPGLQGVHWGEITSLIPLAGSCAIVIVTQSAATSRVYAARHRQNLDENQDLVGLAVANAAAALSGTFVVNGSPTQTAIVEGAGGRSQIAQLTTTALVGVVLLFLTKPLQYLPQCVLGALVFMVAIRLIDLRGLRNMRRESPEEYVLALTTAMVVVAVGVEQGILLALSLSLLRIVRHSYRPHTGVLVQDSYKTWKVIPATRGVTTEPGLVLYSFGATLFYANANRFSEEILSLVGPAPSDVRWLIVDAEAITNIDYSAARVVRDLANILASAGVLLGFARLPAETKADFARHHLTEVIAPSRIFDRLHDALEAFQKLGDLDDGTTHRPRL